MDRAGQQVTDTGTAGVIARPPLLFLAALLIGFVLDRLLRLPFPVPGIDLVHWIIGGSLILIGLARLEPRVFATSHGQGRRYARSSPRARW
jgi:hypothetical protein